MEEFVMTPATDGGAQGSAESPSSTKAPVAQEPAAPTKGKRIQARAESLVESLFNAGRDGFPFLELLGWFANMDDEDFVGLQRKSKAFTTKVKDVLTLVDKFADLDRFLSQLGPIAKGIKSLVRRKPGGAPDHKAVHHQLAREQARAAKPVPQTSEERTREVETRARVHHSLRVLTALVMNSSSTLLSIPVEQTVVPEVMKMRRAGSPEFRLLFDRLANISLDDMDTSHPEVKLAEVAEVLFESGYKGYAEAVNDSIALVTLAREVQPLFEESVVNGTVLAEILRRVAELPVVVASEERQLAKSAAKEAEDFTETESTRRTLLVAAQLLDAGQGHHVRAKKLLSELGIIYHGNIAPMVADMVFLQGEMDESLVTIVHDLIDLYKDYARDQSTQSKEMKDVFAAVMEVANLLQSVQSQGINQVMKDAAIGRVAGHLSQALHILEGDKERLEDALQWLLLFSCNLHGVWESRPICRDYRGEGALARFKAAQTQASGGQPAVQRQPAVPPLHAARRQPAAPLLRRPRVASRGMGPALVPVEEAAFEDAAALVQRSAAVARRPPFPAEQLSGWVASHYGLKVQELQDAIEAAKYAAWLMQPANRELVRGIGRGLKNIVTGRRGNSTRSMQELAAAQKEQERKEEAAKRRRSGRKGPPPKQTPEERQQEKATRASLAHDLELLLTRALKMPAILRAPMEALLVPDAMTMRRKGDHQARMLVDRLAGISLDDLTNTTAAVKAQDVVEAFRASGYNALPKAVDYVGNKTAPLIRLANDLREEAEKGQLSRELTARLLREAALPLAGGWLRPVGAGMGMLAGLVEGPWAGADPADARLALDAVAAATAAVNFALGRGGHSLQALGHQVADVVAAMGASPSLGLPREGLARTAAMLHYVSDLRRGSEPEMVLRGARLAEESRLDAAAVGRVLDEAVAFVCALGGAAARVPACSEA